MNGGYCINPRTTPKGKKMLKRKVKISYSHLSESYAAHLIKTEKDENIYYSKTSK